MHLVIRNVQRDTQNVRTRKLVAHVFFMHSKIAQILLTKQYITDNKINICKQRARNSNALSTD